jgi:TolB protein
VLGGQQAPPLDGATQSWTEHKLRPYGTAPTISRINVAGQEAALVTPSSDAPLNAGKPQALAVIRFPQPITLNGTIYQFLTVTVDASYLDHLLTTLDWN